MDWSNERYVRLYTRDTATWRRLGWEGQCLLCLMLRKVDRAGVLDGLIDAVDDLMLATGLPPEVISVGFERLKKHGVIVEGDGAICFPNFLEAQETPKSDAQRQRDLRERRRAKALLESQNVTGRSQNVTDGSRGVTLASRCVTAGHGASRGVTPTLSDPTLSDPTLSDPTSTKEEGLPASPSPPPANQKGGKKKRKAIEYPYGFKAFWKIYLEFARPEGKFRAFGEWEAAEDILPSLNELRTILERQAIEKREQGINFPYAATWLNERRWEDKPHSHPSKPQDRETGQPTPTNVVWSTPK